MVVVDDVFLTCDVYVVVGKKAFVADIDDIATTKYIDRLTIVPLLLIID